MAVLNHAQVVLFFEGHSSHQASLAIWHTKKPIIKLTLVGHIGYGHDGRGMISAIHCINGANQSGQLADRQYWRDDRDRITAWKRGTDNSQNPEVNATPAARAESFVYDKVGNRKGWNDIATRGHTLSDSALELELG